MNLAEYQNLSKIIAAYLKMDFQTDVMLRLAFSEIDFDVFSFSSCPICFCADSTVVMSSLKQKYAIYRLCIVLFLCIYFLFFFPVASFAADPKLVTKLTSREISTFDIRLKEVCLAFSEIDFDVFSFSSCPIFI